MKTLVTRPWRWLAVPLLAVATAVPMLATAGASASSGPPSYSQDVAGYQVAGRWFRYVSTTVTLPSDEVCVQLANSEPPGFGFGAAITLGNYEESTVGTSDGPASTLGVSMVPTSTGCGLISPSFASNLPGYTSAAQFGAGAIHLYPGNQVRLDLYYNAADQSTTATIYNLSTGAKAASHFTSGAVYQSASATGGFGPMTPREIGIRLLPFTNSKATTYTGVRGTLTGPWQTLPVWLTANGGQSGTLLASPGYLWQYGANFTVWLRATSGK